MKASLSAACAAIALSLTGCVTSSEQQEKAKIEAFRQQSFDEANARIAARVADRTARAAAHMEKCGRLGGVGVGMNAEQVRASCWGKPQRINATVTATGTHEQWVYAGYQYLYLTNGTLTSIQTSGAR